MSLSTFISLPPGVELKTARNGDITIKFTITQDFKNPYKNRETWKNHPRGEIYVFIKEILVSIMIGHRKFGYAEDTSKFGDKSSVVRWFASTKENGENAKVAAFVHDGKSYWVVGSKQGAVVFEEGHLPEEKSPAAEIARVFHAELSLMDVSKQKALHDYLAETGNTFVGEAILKKQEHICTYDETDRIIFFAITTSSKETGPAPIEKGLSMHPLDAYAIFGSLGLPSAPMREIKMSDMAAYLQEIAYRKNSEGDVLYGIDAHGIVCYMEKVKAYYYVVERIVRERIASLRFDELSSSAIWASFLKAEKETASEEKLLHYFFTWQNQRFFFLQFFAAYCLEKGYVRAGMDKKDRWAFQCQWLTLQAECKDVFDASRVAEIQAKIATLSSSVSTPASNSSSSTD
jgi:hypothetical protein